MSIKMTPVKWRLLEKGWLDMESGYPYRRLIEATGIPEYELSQTLGGARNNARVQDAVAKAVGVSVLDLFGDRAWPRIAGAAMRKRLDAMDEAERQDLLRRLAPGGAVAQARERRRQAAFERDHAEQAEKIARRRGDRAAGTPSHRKAMP